MGANWRPASHMLLSKPIRAVVHSTFNILSSPFDVNFKEVRIQLQMQLIDLQCLETDIETCLG